MNSSNKPNLVIVAGPNGAGKSTVAEFLIANRSIENYINADVIAKGMAVTGLAGSDISAGHVLLNQIELSLSRRQSFAFESTMAGTNWINLLDRVRRRVSEGGHDIPENTIRRRYAKSLELFFSTYKDVCDCWYFFDNSGSSALLIASREALGSEIEIFYPEVWDTYEPSR